MKKLALLAAVAALAACSQDEAAVPAETEQPMPAETTAAMDAVIPGTSDVKMADGSMGTTTINADGTYVDTDAEGNEVRGMVANKGGNYCFDPEGDEPEVCWTSTAPGADGSFTATAPDGTKVTVTPRAAAAATPAT